GRPERQGHVRTRSAAETRRAAVLAGARPARAELPGGGAAISEGRAMARERAAHRASESAMASAVLQLVATHAQRNAARHGAGGLVALGAAVRGGGVCRTHRLGQLAGTRFILHARARNPATHG